MFEKRYCLHNLEYLQNISKYGGKESDVFQIIASQDTDKRLIFPNNIEQIKEQIGEELLLLQEEMNNGAVREAKLLKSRLR